MTGTYQSNYRNRLSEGREVWIGDEAEGYYYTLADGDTLQDALDNFAESYDFALDGEDSETVRVRLQAEEYLHGKIVATASRTISPLRDRMA